jgi:endonuclease YncB( thermonuclease family)
VGVVAVAAVVTLLSRGTAGGDGEPIATPDEYRVVDGDTFVIQGRRIRLYGIDAPELGQACTRNGETYDCGNASQEHLRFLLMGEEVHCERRSKDKWGREVASCTAGGRDIATLMVRQGWAVAYTEYSTAYIEDERFARTNGMGMWAKEFLLPEDWRNREGQ